MDKKLIYPSYIEAIISLSANAEVAGIGENLDSLVWSKNPDEKKEIVELRKRIGGYYQTEQRHKNKKIIVKP